MLKKIISCDYNKTSLKTRRKYIEDTIHTTTVSSFNLSKAVAIVLLVNHQVK